MNEPFVSLINAVDRPHFGLYTYRKVNELPSAAFWLFHVNSVSRR
jgi:hypothetical protein